MKNKSGDIPYCGVDKDKIQKFSIECINTENLDLFLYYIRERYKIHLRKDLNGTHQPYTKDSVMQYYRFTNVRREHDRNTIWLIDKVCSNSELKYVQKLANIILFRIFNKVSTAELLEIPVRSFIKKDAIEVAEHVEPLLQDTPYTGAYLCSGMKRYMKQYSGSDSNIESVWIIMQDLQEDRSFWKQLCYGKTPQDIVDTLQQIPGISVFMAYQIFIDFTYLDKFPFSENEFTVAGIGAISGLKLLFGGTKRKHGLTPEELIFWLRDNWNELNQYNIQHGGKYTLNPQILFLDLPEEDRVMNVMSIENCLCEFFKYHKALTGTGRPRQKYIGGSK